MFPPPEHPFDACQVDAVAASRADASRQLQSSLGLANCGLRAALFAARTNSIPPARRSMTVPWRERPRDLAGSAIMPAATERSLTPRCLCLSQSRRSPRCDRRSPQGRAQSAPFLHRPSHSIVRFAVARSRRSALLRPRERAADGLDRAIREPSGGQLSTASREPLDDARRQRYCRILFDGCGPQPPSHRPM